MADVTFDFLVSRIANSDELGELPKQGHEASWPSKVECCQMIALVGLIRLLPGLYFSITACAKLRRLSTRSQTAPRVQGDPPGRWLCVRKFLDTVAVPASSSDTTRVVPTVNAQRTLCKTWGDQSSTLPMGCMEPLKAFHTEPNFKNMSS